MKTLACLLVVVLVAAAIPCPRSWWSIVLWDPQFRNGTLKAFPCDSYNDTITDSQYSLCFFNPHIMSAAVMGLRRALSACNKLFGSDRFGSTCWNCTLYVHRFLLGQAIEDTPNREREFVRMLITASITYEIARACREKLIPDCHCAPSDIPFITKTDNGTLIIAGCDVDMGWAAAYTRLIMNGSDDRIEQHNIEVGITLANRTFRTKVCKGPLGACTIEVHFRAPEPSVVFQDPQNVTRLQTAFREAVWVDISQAGGRWPPNRVVFGSGSQDFCCTRNHSIGIPGTKGRQCNPNASAPDSCDRLCCGQGYNHTSYYKTVKTHKLVVRPPPPHLVEVYRTVKVDSYHCN